MGPPSPSPEVLLERARRARALARALITDAATADDVAQDALLASLDAGREGEAGSGWLARKVRSLASRARRGRARRALREAAAARPEAAPSAAELVERAWLQRKLVEAVVGLEQPYRSALLLRYFEDLPPREIARLQGVPVRTVQTHLSRGLAQLRARLDRELGPRTWATLLAPLAWRHAPAPPLAPAGTAAPSTLALATGGILVQTKLKLVVAAVAAVVVTTLAVVFRPGADAAQPAATAPGVELALLSLPEGAQEAGTPTQAVQGTREEPAELSAPSPRRAEEGPPGPIDRDRDLFGEVVDLAGSPVLGALVSVQRREQEEGRWAAEPDEEPETVASTSTDERGRFRLRLEPGPLYALAVEHSSYATARLSDRYAGEKVRVVLTVPASVHGCVLRELDGSAVAGAEVSLRLRPDGPVVHMESWQARCDDQGRYQLDGLPAGTYDAWVVCPDDPSPDAPSITLEAGEVAERNLRVPAPVAVRGQVLDAATGHALADAEVSASGSWQGPARTDLDGRFELRTVAADSDGVDLRARADSYATGVWRLRKGQEPYDDLRLELERGFTAVGRILDPSGRPLQGVVVRAYGRLPLLAPGSGQELPVRGPADRAAATTAANGRFLLQGLSLRSRHTLVARKAGLGSLVVDFPDQETEGGEVELGDLALHAPASIRGRVVDREGRPVPQAWLTLEGGDAGRNRFSLGPSPDVDAFVSQRGARVDDLGRFTATDLGPGTWTILATCAGVREPVARTIGLVAGEQRAELELVLDVGADEDVIAGRVVGPDGAPVFGVHVEAHPAGGRGESPLQVAGMNVETDGSFVLRGLAPGSYALEATLWSPEQSDLCPTRLDGVSTGSRGVVLRLPRRATIRGRVLRPDGTPCAAGAVQVDFGETTYGGFLSVPTDAEGGFELPVPAGERVDLVAHELAGTTLWLVRARGVTAGTEGLVLRLEP